MGSFVTKLPVLTISSGQQESNVLSGFHFQDAAAIVLYAPATLDGAHVYGIQVSGDYNWDSSDGSTAGVAATWQTWQQGDTAPGDAAAPLAGKARTYLDLPGVRAMRIRDVTAVTGADRTWQVSKLYVND